MAALEWLDRTFAVSANGSTIKTEVLSGIATFFTASFILTVNPQLLNDGLGLSKKDVAVSTAVVSCIATSLVGFVTNKPFCVTPAMGYNALVALTVSDDGKKPDQALAAVLISGVVLAVAAASGFLTRLSGVVPPSLRNATVAGIGLFIALVGLQNAKLVTNGALGDLEDSGVWLFVFGFCLMLFLETIGCQNGVLTTMVIVSAIAWSAGLSDPPSKIIDVADEFDAVWQISFKDWVSPTYLGLFTLIYTDLLIQPSNLIAVASLPGIQPEGLATHELPKYAWKVWFITGCCNVLAAILGCSPLLVVMESAAGVRSGGRTGLTSMVVALLFALSIFFAPVLASFPTEATACPLLLVGALMIGGVKDIDWRDMGEGGPAFVTLLMIPFTFNVGHGLLAGLLASVVCRIGRRLRPWYARTFICCRLEPPKGDNTDFDQPQKAYVVGDPEMATEPTGSKFTDV